MPEDSDLLFSGLKVLDVGTWIAGPVSATILADFGASVIKVEIPGAGDPYRALAIGPLSPPARRATTCWICDGREQAQHHPQPRPPEGHDILLRLVRECDVYVTNQPIPKRREARPPLRRPRAPQRAHDLRLAHRLRRRRPGCRNSKASTASPGGRGRASWTGSARRASTPGMSVPGMGDHPPPSRSTPPSSPLCSAGNAPERAARSTRACSRTASGRTPVSARRALVGADLRPDARTQARRKTPNRVLFATSDGRLLQLYMVAHAGRARRACSSPPAAKRLSPTRASPIRKRGSPTPPP